VDDFFQKDLSENAGGIMQRYANIRDLKEFKACI